MATTVSQPRPAITREPADLDARFTAYAVDRALGWGLAALAATVAGLLTEWANPALLVVVLLSVLGLVTLALAVMLSSSGRTPGGIFADVVVQRAGGEGPPPLGAAVLRAVTLGVAGLPTLGLGLAALGWTAAADPTGARRGWHDLATGTRVLAEPTITTQSGADPVAPQGVVNLTTLRLMPVSETPVAPVPVASPEPVLPPGPAAPVALSVGWQITFDSGESMVVDGPILLGRGPAARPGETVKHLVPLRSSQMSLSKTHAGVHVAADGALVVVDRGSTNGSVLVRRGMTRDLAPGRPTTLVDGDRVRFGDREMVVARVG